MTTVLVADDSPAVRLLVRRILEPAYQVHEAVDGEQALNELQTQRPAVVILDVTMPGLTGLEVCQRIRADPALGSMGVIIMTANGGPADATDAQRVGADAFVTKPFSPARLVHLVDVLAARAAPPPA